MLDFRHSVSSAGSDLRNVNVHGPVPERGLIRVPVDPLRGAPASGLQPTPEDCQYGRGASCGAKEHGEEK